MLLKNHFIPCKKWGVANKMGNTSGCPCMITMGYENYALKNPIKTWRYESSNLSNMATESTLDCGSINNY